MSEASKLITVIGRGHSGTRAIALTLQASGVFMGAFLNESTDMLPPDDMYEACRVMGKYVTHLGGENWDFSDLHEMEIDTEFTRLATAYLDPILSRETALKGWKLPETTLVYPWIARMFPDAYFIQWYRDPRDSIMGGHQTDDVTDFGVPCDLPEDHIARRALSWHYQHELIKATPAPKNVITVRFEDFVLEQEATLSRLEEFLGFPLARIRVNSDRVHLWKKQEGELPEIPFLAEAIRELGYE